MQTVFTSCLVERLRKLEIMLSFSRAVDFTRRSGVSKAAILDVVVLGSSSAALCALIASRSDANYQATISTHAAARQLVNIG